jgi:para-aminobenzoate synthetase component 1
MNNNKLDLIDTIYLDYQPDLAKNLFAPIAKQSWSMLLRSAAESHPDSRFDILVARPKARLITRNDVTEVYTEESMYSSTDDPFLLLDKTLATLLPRIENSVDLPFIGGALGYFSYDLGRRVESIPVIATNDIHTPDMAIGIYDWTVIVDHQKKSAVIVGENVKEQLEWLVQQGRTNQVSADHEFALTSEWQSNMTKAAYTEKFDTVKQYLLAGDCYQINLAQRYKARFTGNSWSAYQTLEEANQAPFSSYIQLEDSAILSISPERFLQVKGDAIETKPIKGTRPRSDNPEHDLESAQNLASTEKDQAENLMIVDLLRNDIGRVAKPGTVSVPSLFDVESFPAVHHLVSTVNAQLDTGYTVTDLLRACFPGGSITGAPKVRAMEIIEELEPHRRSVYCGSIGYISRCGQMDTNIAIRTLVAYNSELYAWAGGGLVADSNADSEYQETLDKLSKILPVLRNAS